MTRFSVILTVLTFLLVPAAASAYTGFPANASQRLGIEQSAKATQICGYDGQYQQLSDFRTVTYQTGNLTVRFGSAAWTPPDEDGDACLLVFVSQPGYVLKSVATAKHPFVSWVPISWGSDPLQGASYDDQLWRNWFTATPPNWSALIRAL